MQDFDGYIEEFEAVWAKAYENALNSPSTREQYLTESSLSALNESVSVAVNWLKRIRAPAGFSPGFHVAKSVCEIYLPQIISSAKNIVAGQFNHFGNFSAHLTNVLNAIHTMGVFQAKDGDSTVADLSAELIQSIELINTAQKELSEKISLLNQASDKFNEIESYRLDIEDKKDITTNLLTEINNDLESLGEKTSTLEQLTKEVTANKLNFEQNIKNYEQQLSQDNAAREKKHNEIIQELYEEGERLKTENLELHQKLIEKTERLEVLIQEAEKQSQVIDSILPKAASAGLAAAFSKRVEQLNITKWLWLAIFTGSLIGLFFFAKSISLDQIENMDQFVSRILYKLPLSAPIIWLAWFSAIQYGNNIRIQEDYAFKEATSKAFQGYKDHMEHLGNIDINEAETAMTLLSASTIRILGNEPTRIYGKSQSDASPAHNLADLLKSIGANRKSD